jgi:integrase
VQNQLFRTIPLNTTALAAFEQQRLVSGNHERVFITEEGKPFIKKSIRRWFEEALVKAKINDFRWHDQRHTFCSRLAMAGILKTIQELAGHKTIQMTARYAHLSPDHLHKRSRTIGNSHQTATGLHARPRATGTATRAKRATPRRRP